MKVKIVEEVKRSDGLWRFACGDVFYYYLVTLDMIFDLKIIIQTTAIQEPSKMVKKHIFRTPDHVWVLMLADKMKMEITPFLAVIIC